MYKKLSIVIALSIVLIVSNSFSQENFLWLEQSKNSLVIMASAQINDEINLYTTKIRNDDFGCGVSDPGTFEYRLSRKSWDKLPMSFNSEHLDIFNDSKSSTISVCKIKKGIKKNGEFGIEMLSKAKLNIEYKKDYDFDFKWSGEYQTIEQAFFPYKDISNKSKSLSTSELIKAYVQFKSITNCDILYQYYTCPSPFK